MKQSLEDQGDDDNEGANGRDDPCRRELQRLGFPSSSGHGATRVEITTYTLLVVRQRGQEELAFIRMKWQAAVLGRLIEAN